MEKIEEIVAAVTSINIDLHEDNAAVGKLIDNGLAELEVRSNGFAIEVNFLGTQIWNSEDDERPYDEVKDEYTETMEVFLRRTINEMVKVLATIKV